MANSEFDFIPLSGGGDYKKLAWYDAQIRDRCPVVTKDNTWYIEGEAQAEFDVEPGSGYRIFVEWVSETKNEKYPIDAYVYPIYDVDCTKTEDLKMAGGATLIEATMEHYKTREVSHRQML